MFALTLHAVADSLTLIHQGTKNRVELERNYGIFRRFVLLKQHPE
jgi:hypothetical protein